MMSVDTLDNVKSKEHKTSLRKVKRALICFKHLLLKSFVFKDVIIDLCWNRTYV